MLEYWIISYLSTFWIELSEEYKLEIGRTFQEGKIVEERSIVGQVEVQRFPCAVIRKGNLF